jgi:hypothetical protein
MDRASATLAINKNAAAGTDWNASCTVASLTPSRVLRSYGLERRIFADALKAAEDESSNLASEYDETRKQGCDCPPNKRAILDYPLQHGDSVP